MQRSEYDFDVCSGPAMPPPVPVPVSKPKPPAGTSAGEAASLDPAPAAADRVKPT